MSRYIEADAIIEELLCTTPKLPYKSTTDLVKAQEIATLANKIDSAPTIEIIRCKNCKHWCKGDDVYGICYRCPNTRQMRYDDFCSYGEERVME